MLKNIICPVSFERIDSKTSRVGVLMNTVLMVIFLITLQPTFLFAVTGEYIIRSLGYTKFSPINILASLAISAFGIRHKMIDKAPKVFASLLGLICAILGIIFLYMEMPLGSRIVIGLFATLTLLDSVANFCVGCVIYHHLVFPFLGNGTNNVNKLDT